ENCSALVPSGQPRESPPKLVRTAQQIILTQFTLDTERIPRNSQPNDRDNHNQRDEAPAGEAGIPWCFSVVGKTSRAA
ncbi:MAG: hypothetical protein AAB263_13260, partial [Planctomycetota bacterium]